MEFVVFEAERIASMLHGVWEIVLFYCAGFDITLGKCGICEILHSYRTMF